MRLLAMFAATAALACWSSPAPALRIAIQSPSQRALSAETVVVGKVTAIEKEMVEVTPFVGAKNKVKYKIAVVQVEKALSGTKNDTHIKVGFLPPPPPINLPPLPPGVRRPPIRRGPLPPQLKEGQEFLFFLSKHREANFFVMSAISPPLDAKAAGTEKEIKAIQKVLAIVADPMKHLKAEKAADRGFAAAVIAIKYRTFPNQSGPVEQSPISAEESQLILKGLTEADWSKFDRSAPTGVQAFYALGLRKNDGWEQPKPVRAQPGQPAPNYNLILKAAFVKWLSGPGKDYRIKQFVPKKK